MAKPSPAALALAGSLAVAAALLLALATLPNLPITVALHDTLIPLDTGWRIGQGQIAHTDFLTPMGPAYNAATALAQSLWGHRPVAIAGMNVLIALILAPLLWGISFRTLPPGQAAGCAILLLLVAVAPRHAGLGFEQLSWMAVYNRWGWALYTAAAALCLLKTSPANTKGPLVFLDGLLLAALATLAFWIKITYAVGIGVCALATAALFSASRRSILLSLTIAGAVAGTWLVASADGRGFFHDMLRVIAVSSGRPDKPIGYLISLDFLTWTTALALTVTVALVALRAKKPHHLKSALALTLWAGCGLVLATQTGDLIDEALPLCVLILAGLLLDLARSPLKPALIVTAWVGGVLALVPAGQDLLSIGFAASTSRDTAHLGYVSPWDTFPRLNPAFAALLATGELSPPSAADGEADGPRDIEGRDWLLSLDAGNTLLDRHATSVDRILTAAFVNPFPFLRQTPAPRGVPLWFDWARTYNTHLRESDAAVFADVDLLMIPKFGFDYGQSRAFCYIFKDAITTQFTVLDQNPLWILLKKGGDGPKPAIPPGLRCL